jgi:hypothetical protein
LPNGFLIEYAVAMMFPLVVLIAFLCGKRHEESRVVLGQSWSFRGIRQLADTTIIQVIFDTFSIAVVNTLVSASLCRLSDPAYPPHLLSTPTFTCLTPVQITMAVAGWFGLLVWYLWISIRVTRMSFESTPVLRLYDFVFAAVLMQARVALGVLSATLAQTWPKVLVSCVFGLTLVMLLAGFLTGGGPCRFPRVNCMRTVSLGIANLSSVLVFFALFYLVDGHQYEVWHPILAVGVLLISVCILILISRMCRRHTVSRPSNDASADSIPEIVNPTDAYFVAPFASWDVSD